MLYSGAIVTFDLEQKGSKWFSCLRKRRVCFWRHISQLWISLYFHDHCKDVLVVLFIKWQLHVFALFARNEKPFRSIFLWSFDYNWRCNEWNVFFMKGITGGRHWKLIFSIENLKNEIRNWIRPKHPIHLEHINHFHFLFGSFDS